MMEFDADLKRLRGNRRACAIRCGFRAKHGRPGPARRVLFPL